MQISDNEIGYREYLQREFMARIEANPRYSLRAYARDLGLLPSALSETLRGLRGLSREKGKLVARKLGMEAREEKYFLSLIDSRHARSSAARAGAAHACGVLKAQQGFRALDLAWYRVLADWYHFAILELTTVSGFQASYTWISRRLRLPIGTVETAVQRLLKLKLLQRKKGVLCESDDHISSPEDLPSREIRNHHKQIMQQAARALDEVEVLEREFASMIMAIDTHNIPEAKKCLREFRRKFCRDLQKTGERNRVYCLSMQFFPLDQPEKPI